MTNSADDTRSKDSQTTPSRGDNGAGTPVLSREEALKLRQKLLAEMASESTLQDKASVDSTDAAIATFILPGD
ncbi:MAG: hypothetical protein AAGA91_02760 [Pseudomonadota bacterium]